MITKKIFFSLILVSLIFALFSKNTLATHTGTNIVVSTLHLTEEPVVTTAKFGWTPAGSTPGILVIGTNTSDPIVDASPSTTINTGGNVASLGVSPLVDGTYSAAMYTGFGASLTLMSNVVVFQISHGSGPVVSSDGTAECANFSSCSQFQTDVQTRGGFSDSQFITSLVSQILPIIIGIGGFLSVIFILISAVQFVTSNGNPDAAAAARGRLTFAIIGFVLLVLAFAIAKVIDAMFLKSGVLG